MKKIIFFTAYFMLGLCISVFAEVSIKAEVGKTNVTTDEPFSYKLNIVTTEKNIGQPQLPDFSNFHVISQSQSSNISFTGSGTKTTIILNLILIAPNAGEFTIGPCVIKAKDKTYSGESFQIKVIQGKVRSKPQPKKNFRLPKEEGAQMPQITL